jgi:multicomponent Na+:H+ antiporter subunit D
LICLGGGLFLALWLAAGLGEAPQIEAVTLPPSLPGIALGLGWGPLGLLQAGTACLCGLLALLIPPERHTGSALHTAWHTAWHTPGAWLLALLAASASGLAGLFLAIEPLAYLAWWHTGLHYPHPRRAHRLAGVCLLASSLAGIAALALCARHGVDGAFALGGGGLAGIAPQDLDPLYLLLVAGTLGKLAPLAYWTYAPNHHRHPAPLAPLFPALLAAQAGGYALLRAEGELLGPGLLPAGNMGLPLVLTLATLAGLAALLALGHAQATRRLALFALMQILLTAAAALLAQPAAFAGAMWTLALQGIALPVAMIVAAVPALAPHRALRLGDLRQRAALAGAFLLATLTLLGLPPTGGLWGYWSLYIGAAGAMDPRFLLIATLLDLLGIALILPLPWQWWVGQGDPTRPARLPLPWATVLACLAPALLLALLFFFPAPLERLVQATLAPAPTPSGTL